MFYSSFGTSDSISKITENLSDIQHRAQTCISRRDDGDIQQSCKL